MLIILEGPSGSGKTTLANALRDHLGRHAQVITGDPEPADPFAAFEWTISKSYDGYTPLIMDGWHISEQIKRAMKETIEPVGHWHIDSYLAARGALIIYLLPPPTEIGMRLTNAGRDVNPHDILDEFGAYSMMSELSNSTTFRYGCPTGYHCTQPDHDAPVLDEITAYAYAEWLRCAAVRNFKTYVGVPTPDYLILGETRNDPELYDAAFVPTGASSGKYMLDHLMPVLGGEKSVGIANACEENVFELWTTLGRPPMVALGNNAFKSAQFDLRDTDAQLGAVPHPQYIRRFHHKAGALYARTLMSTLSTGEDLRSWRPAS